MPWWLKKVWGRRAKSSKPEQLSESPVPTTEQVFQIGDDLEMRVMGFPAELTIDQQQSVVYYLMREALASSEDREFMHGDNVYQGRASIRIGEEIYGFDFSLSALRAMTALAVYKKAFDVVGAGMRNGAYDYELAEATAGFIKESAWREMVKLGAQVRPNLITSPSIKILPILGNGGKEQ